MPDPARFQLQTPIDRRRALLGVGLVGTAAVAGCATDSQPPRPARIGPFHHGVASGDPLQDRVILWTRVTLPPERQDPFGVTLSWEIARDRGLTDVVGRGETTAAPGRDWTAKIDVGALEPGTEYFYRFALGDERSPVGRTKTLPAGRVERFRIAAFSCSNYPFGFFNAYRHMAEGPAVDLALHLGDYFYEYGPDGYGAEVGEKLGRIHAPAKEVITLVEYRARHAQYKADPDLQAAHAAAPWITIWDDHESANNAFVTGAQNHDPETEGEWSARKVAAVRAYLEWMPIREPEAGRAREAIWRRFEIGDLASLVMLETRLTARSPEITWDEFPVADDADPTDPDNQAKVAAFLADRVGDPSRVLLGPAQEADVVGAVEASVAAGKPWQLIGNQVIMSPVQSPNWTDVVGFWTGGVPGFVRGKVKGNEVAWGYFLRSRFGIPLNLDAWDGFPAQRDRLFTAFRDAKANVVTFTGDTHSFWANNMVLGADRVGVEFGVTGVTSPSAFRSLRAPGLNAGRAIERANPNVVANDPYNNGYVRAELTPERMTAEFVGVATLERRSARARVLQRFTTRPTPNGGSTGVETLSA